MKKIQFIFLFLFSATLMMGQAEPTDTAKVYKKRVLESPEIQFLASYYSQDGDNAAVTGGTGTEELTDVHPTVVISIPINADDVLTAEAGISAYSSASSSNVDALDGKGEADAFQASSGASSSDTWINASLTYSHSSDDRNQVISGNVSYATEYDYNSIGGGVSYTRLFNQKNTELSVKANVYIDRWKVFYPRELRPFDGGSGLNSGYFSRHTITGNTNYAPSFTSLDKSNRNSYSLGFSFSQIMTENLQGSLLVDLVRQDGLLSTPFHRVYFFDVEDSFIDKFHLADDIERLPDSRFKTAVGGRLHYYINERFVLRSYYRFYQDDWGIQSHTVNLELPIKLTDKFTIYPSYRYYSQTAADYFAPYNKHVSTASFYTSDYDLSNFQAHQYSFGISYTDIFTKVKLYKLGLKSIDLRGNYYERDSGLKAFNIGIGLKFVWD